MFRPHRRRQMTMHDAFPAGPQARCDRLRGIAHHSSVARLDAAALALTQFAVLPLHAGLT